MQTQSLQQLYSFIIFILVGFLIGLLFDMFRISRKTFKTSDIVTSLEDILFWILTGLLIIFSLFKFNNGDIRVYIIVSLIIGITIYMLLFSKIVITILVKFINVIKKIVSYILKFILYPVRLILKILKILFKPIKKIQNNMTNKIKKILKMKKMQNKSNSKKDFA